MRPSEGGCWICHESGDGMIFDMEFDTFVHTDCLDEHGVESVLEYEKQKSPDDEIKYE